jgi:hypothetical protein
LLQESIHVRPPSYQKKKNRELTKRSRGATVTDASKRPLPDNQIAVGHKLVVKAQMPPTMDNNVKPRVLAETVIHVAPGRQFVWGASESPRMFFGAQRWHVLTDVQGGTKYEIIAVLSGIGGSLAMRFMRQSLTDAMEGMAEGLKTRCEQS